MELVEHSEAGRSVLPPRLSARRLVRQDLPGALALYAGMGRDGAWACAPALEALLRTGEVWGGFADGELVFCCALARPTDACAQAQALAQAAPGYAMQLLSPAFAPGHVPSAARFFTLLRARLWQLGIPDAQAVACLPVKTGAPLLAGMFAAHFVLTAVRPLYELRPHYLFRLLPEGIPAPENGRVLLPVGDTLSISRLLEHGFFAASVLRRGEVLLLSLQTDPAGPAGL